MRSIAQQAIIANLSSCLSKPDFLPPWSAELSAVCPCCLRFFSYKPASTTSVRLSPFDSPDSFNLWWVLWKSLPVLLLAYWRRGNMNWDFQTELLLSFKTHNLNSNGMWLLYPYTAEMRWGMYWEIHPRGLRDFPRAWILHPEARVIAEGQYRGSRCATPCEPRYETVLNFLGLFHQIDSSDLSVPILLSRCKKTSLGMMTPWSSCQHLYSFVHTEHCILIFILNKCW